MPGLFHRLAVARLCAEFPDAQTKGFRRAVIAAVQGACAHLAPCGEAGCGCPCDAERAARAWDEAGPACRCHREGCECVLAEVIPARIGGLQPDAFRVVTDDDGLTRVIAFEVEDAHKMPPQKLARYLALWWLLDATVRYVLEIVIVDRYGEDRLPLDLVALAYAEASEAS